MSDWRRTRDYRVWRAHVIRRDGKCVCCHSRQNRHAHHIKHATYSPELKFDVSNGVTLCQTCHSVLHNKIAGGTRIKCDEKHLERLIYLKTKWLSYVIEKLTTHYD